MTWLYPILRFLRKLVFFLGGRVSEEYDDQQLTRLIIAGDRQHLNLGGAGGCNFTKQAFSLLETRGIHHPTVLDFGGGGGRCGFFLESEGAGKWVVLETPAMVREAQIQLADSGLLFADSLDQVRNFSSQFDMLHISSSIQYTPQPEAMLAALLEFSPQVIVFEKLVLTEKRKVISFDQFSFLGDNIPGSSFNVRSWILAAKYPLTAIPLRTFMDLILPSFRISFQELDPPQSHLPLFRGLRQMTLIVERL